MILLALVLLLALLTPDMDRLQSRLLVTAAVLEVVALGVVSLPAGRRLRPWFGLLMCEEFLVVSGLAAPYLDGVVTGWRLGVFLTAVLITGALLLRLPLPERLFPVRGVWLRRLLSMTSLLALLHCGPWAYAWSYVRAAIRPLGAIHPLLELHLLLGALILAHVWTTLVHSPLGSLVSAGNRVHASR